MIPEVFFLDEVREALNGLDSLALIEKGFIAYSQGKVVVPPVGEMVFDHPPGDVHIKYGYIVGDDYYVIKIASGFYENVNSGIPNTSGLMLLFKQQTGELICILLDEGYLTNVRTAAAGAVVARYLAPQKIECIGIIGSGIQGRMQLEYLKPVIECRDVLVWGLSERELFAYREDMEPLGFRVEITLCVSDIPARCNLIVTATPSQNPLLHVAQIRKGTHITAVGSDTPQKNELDPHILRQADIVVADSIEQSHSRGEVFRAVKTGVLSRDHVLELGHVIADKKLGRTGEDQISVADLTGVAVQDIQIAKAVARVLMEGKLKKSNLRVSKESDMRVFVNHQAIEIFWGAHVRDVLMKYSVEDYGLVMAGKKIIVDERGNRYNLDGEISDGDCFTLETTTEAVSNEE